EREGNNLYCEVPINFAMAALVTRKDLCEVHIRTGQTEVAVFTAYESE
ncbi:Hok/Gef family protein, partial [Escherichia sp. HC-CC4]